MKNAKIELKRVKTFRGHDGVGLDCDLYVNGKKVATVFDSANGGSWDISPYGKTPEEIKSNRALLQELEEHIKTLPEKQWPAELGGGNYQQDLETFINDLLYEMEKAKVEKALEKKFPTHFVLYNKTAGTTRTSSFGKPVVPLVRIPVARLQETYDNLKAQLTEGERIINTNLQALGIQI